ncbi:hypothetical protein GW17_00023585 [Ensete ventricosum]|nr:hypothetical protein GW17_00023585 [Ensete ventricosum]
MPWSRHRRPWSWWWVLEKISAVQPKAWLVEAAKNPTHSATYLPKGSKRQIGGSVAGPSVWCPITSKAVGGNNTEKPFLQCTTCSKVWSRMLFEPANLSSELSRYGIDINLFREEDHATHVDCTLGELAPGLPLEGF